MESDSSRRFSCLSEEEKTALLKKAISDSTKSATKFWISVLSEFASTKGMAIDFATVQEESLARLLENFYCSLKKKEGTEYKRASYLGARGAVQREPPQPPNECSLPGIRSGEQAPRRNFEGEEVGGLRGSCHSQRERFGP